MKKRFLAFMAFILMTFGGITPANVAIADPPPNIASCTSASVNSPYATPLVIKAEWNYAFEAAFPKGTWCVNDFRGFRIVFQGDCNLVVYDREFSGGRALWNSGTICNAQYAPGIKISFQRDGGVVIYRANGTVWWSNGVGFNIEFRNCMRYSFGVSSSLTRIEETIKGYTGNGCSGSYGTTTVWSRALI